jgi:hypothetical protein
MLIIITFRLYSRQCPGFFFNINFMMTDDNVIFHDADVCFLNSIVARL